MIAVFMIELANLPRSVLRVIMETAIMGRRRASQHSS